MTPRRCLTLLLALVALALAGGTAHADDDDVGLEHYDSEAADTSWPGAIGLDDAGRQGTGQGVTVAVLDTGVVPHPDLGDRVVARVDLTGDADGYDRYGHGTHMTGLIAGNGGASAGRHAGVAPGARVLSVKVADWDGATDVSAVLGGLEWIAAHGPEYGVRVVNLSLGTPSSQKYETSPLNHAVERLWRQGILVVTAAGNRGRGGSKIDKPADDPFVLTVGGADTQGTAKLGDDAVAPFSSRGPTHDGIQKPDLVAPSVNLVSHRVPESSFDAFRPDARVGDSYFKGSGTSAAAAVVSGVAALLYERNPALTPDQVKEVLTSTASSQLAGSEGAGAGLVNAGAALAAVRKPPRAAGFAGRASTGTGPLDSSRGSLKPYAAWKEKGKPEQISGEWDVLGNRWDATTWAERPWTAETWSTSPWAPVTVVASGWEPAPEPRVRWGGMSPDKDTYFSKWWRDAGWGPDAWSKWWRTGPWK
jgi:serine protease AprX